MICVNCDYRLKADIEFLLEAENINMLEFLKRTRVSRTTLDEIMKKTMLEEMYAKRYISLRIIKITELIL